MPNCPGTVDSALPFRLPPSQEAFLDVSFENPLYPAGMWCLSLFTKHPDREARPWESDLRLSRSSSSRVVRGSVWLGWGGGGGWVGGRGGGGGARGPCGGGSSKNKTKKNKKQTKTKTQKTKKKNNLTHNKQQKQKNKKNTKKKNGGFLLILLCFRPFSLIDPVFFPMNIKIVFLSSDLLDCLLTTPSCCEG